MKRVSTANWVRNRSNWNEFNIIVSPISKENWQIMEQTLASVLPREMLTVTSNFSTEELYTQTPYRLPLWGVVVMIIGYICVFVFGLVGNCSVLIVVSRLHRMRTVTNYFICNLALADLLVLLFCLLPNLISNIYIPWILGWFMCKTVPYIQGISVCASVYSLVAISMERCISIRCPFRYQITKGKAKKIMLAIWIWSCSVALPWVLYFNTYNADSEHPEMLFCVEKWPDSHKSWSNYYFLFGNCIICYVLPLGIIFICYLTIWFRAYSHTFVLPGYNPKIGEMIHQKAKTAVTKTLIVIVLIFALSWLPLYVITLRMKFGSETKSDLENDVISFIYPFAQWLGCSNSGINPVVYSFLNKKFRVGFYMICKCTWNRQQTQPELPKPLRRHPPIRQTVNIELLKERQIPKMRVRAPSMLYDSE
ncbi:Neuropeptide FF receptor 2 [Orchesella cincta]|uniref:Neuropeptide FF receptor 2 n=1 Tax=Orchesella cincta TaxID=48709 RepID=A0A1D2MDE5_ORCCI|nr:Neuropeptide FF receptor 2 [Orchesella cincta]